LKYIYHYSTSSTNCQQEQQSATVSKNIPTSNKYEDLTALFQEWRTFENPPLRDGAPDYTAETFKKRWLFINRFG